MSAKGLLSQSISFVDDTLMTLTSRKRTYSIFRQDSSYSSVASIASSPPRRLEDSTLRHTSYGWFSPWAINMALSPRYSTLYPCSFFRAFIISGALGLCMIFGLHSFKRSTWLRWRLRCIGSAYRGVSRTLLSRSRRMGCRALKFSAYVLEHSGRRL